MLKYKHPYLHPLHKIIHCLPPHIRAIALELPQVFLPNHPVQAHFLLALTSASLLVSVILSFPTNIFLPLLHVQLSDTHFPKYDCF